MRVQEITAAALCAALYAVAKAATAFIPTPWGIGQFAPGVVVPAFFAILYGPLVGALGGGIGVFVGDLYLSTFGLTNPFLSLIAGVPANFVGFYLLGWLLHKWGSWRLFLWASLIGLTIGNLIAASVVVFYISTFLGAFWPFDVQLATTLGLTLFWITTMLPFVLAIIPPLVKAVSKSRLSSLTTGLWLKWRAVSPSTTLKDSLAVAAVFAAISAILVLTPWGDLLFATVKVPLNTFLIKSLTAVTAITTVIFGPLATLLAKT
ncbi:MAG: ECF transporter S component [Nitrososphaerales archaeon]